MKYDELHVDHQSGVIFQNPDTQFCMPKVYEELAFVLENPKSLVVKWIMKLKST